MYANRRDTPCLYRRLLLVSPDASPADLAALADDLEPTDDVTWSTP